MIRQRVKRSFIWSVFFLASGVFAEIPQIIIPEEADHFEKRAAEELSFHLEKATGQKAYITTERNLPEKPAYYIGRTVYSSDAAFHYNEVNKESFVIKSKDGSLILLGQSGLGTIYAVYEYLERFLGVVWCRPDFSYIPELEKITIPEDVDYSFLPGLKYRSFNTPVENSDDQRVFMVRNRVNYFATDQAMETYQTNLKHLGIEPLYGSPRSMHTHRFYYMKDFKYSIDAEYSSMFARDEKGIPYRRAKNQDQFAQICPSNLKTRDLFVKRLKEFICNDRQDSRYSDTGKPFLYDVSANDDASYCKCNDCLSGIRKYGAYSGVVLEFLNAIAEEIEKEYPDVYLQTFAYMYTFNPPKPGTIKAHPQVIIRLCQMGGDFSRLRMHKPLNLPFRDPPRGLLHAANEKMVEHFMQWRSIAQLSIWDYQTLYRRYPEISDFCYSIPQNYRFYQKHGIEILFAEMNKTRHMVFFPLRRWVSMHFAYAPNDDTDREIDRFMNAYYGTAKNQMKKLLQYVNERNEEYSGSLSADADILRTDNDIAFFAYAEKLLTEAEAAALSSPFALAHIQADRAYFDYVKFRKYTNTLPLEEMIRLCERLVVEYPLMLRIYHSMPENEIAAAVRPLNAKLQILKAAYVLEKKPPLLYFLGRRVIADIQAPDFMETDIMAFYPDPDALNGMAAKIVENKNVPHQAEMTSEQAEFQRLEMGFYDYGDQNISSHRKVFLPKQLPDDEKYHLFKLGPLQLTPGCMLYVDWTWKLQFDLSDLFPLSKGKECNIYVSIKVPAGGKYSLATDVMVDRVIITEIELLPEMSSELPVPGEIGDRKVCYDITGIMLTALQHNPMELVNDPDSVCGIAMKYADEKMDTHKLFRYGVYDVKTKTTVQKTIHPKNLPADEKYHLYSLGEITLPEQGYIYAHQSCALQMNTENFFSSTGNNTYEVWLSLKVQGKGYVKDSQKETAVFLARILLIHPEEKQ